MYEHVLVGTDGSSTAAIAVNRAAEVAKATGAALTILTAGKGDKAVNVAQAAVRAVDAAGVKADWKVVEGDAATALVTEAEDGGYDLLVVGNKGMTGLSRFVAGSVPNKISHRAPCALLIVRTT